MAYNHTDSPHDYSIKTPKNQPPVDNNQQHEEVPKGNTPSIEKTRMVIVCIAAFLALLSFIAFIITGDTRTLLGTSVLTYPLYKVIDYYFGRPETLK